MDINFLQNIEFDFPHILIGILGLTLLIQLYFILIVHGKLAFYKIKELKKTTNKLPVSVIICAHNEEDNLKSFLPAILRQNYPDFEVVVVNDDSSDDTNWILKEFCSRYSHLRVIDIKEHIRLKHNKKFALSIGIKGAKYNHMLLTDADCEPTSDQWLEHMMQPYQDTDKEIVLGYSPYFKKKGFLNKFIRFETTFTAMTYLGMALKKRAYMGVGRNLSYTKELFYRGKGFNAHMHIRSGDDDLFINHNANRRNTAICIHPEAHIYSLPQTSWKSYYKQKARHSTASTAYKKRYKITLGLQYVSALLFYLTLIAALIFIPYLWYMSVFAYFFRLLCQLCVYYPVFKKLSVEDLIWAFPFLDLFYYFFISINGILNRHKKQIAWS